MASVFVCRVEWVFRPLQIQFFGHDRSKCGNTLFWFCYLKSTVVNFDWPAGSTLGPFAFNLLPYFDEYGSRPILADWIGIGAVCSQPTTVLRRVR